MDLHDGLRALASELDLLHDLDGEVEVKRHGDDWLAYSPVQLHRTWQYDNGRFVYPIGAKTLHVAARTHHGTETAKGGYWFRDPQNAVKALADLEHDLAVPFPDRPITISTSRGGLLVQVEARDGDDLNDWERDTYKTKWSRIFGAVKTAKRFDDLRWVDQKGEPLNTADGFYFLNPRRGWTWKADSSVKNILQHRGLSKPEAEQVMGELHLTGKLRVCEPFKPEYPDDHTWNLGAPQFAYTPKPGEHPNWDRMFRHLGGDLDATLATLPWAKGWRGADYLKAWYAAILQDPSCQLPYLFFFGDENTGKSSYWEAFQLLVTGGVVKADRALTSDHNGELEGAILCAVEEKDIATTPGAHARIKDLVTTRTLAIRRMRVDQYQTKNLTHWAQFANHKSACPVFAGDTRITAIAVGPLEHEIPKDEFFDLLRGEAPAILHTLKEMTLPEAEGRLRLPALSTSTKEQLQEDSAHDLAKAVVDLMVDKAEWKGTAKQLWSGGDMRAVRKILDRSKPYLRSRGISVEFGGKTEHGKVVAIHKTT